MANLVIEKVLSINNYDPNDRKPILVCNLVADTVADLPQRDQSTFYLGIGSKADVIYDGSVYKMQSDGTWVLQPSASSGDGYTKSEVDQLIQDTKDYADGEIVGAINDLDVPAVGGTTRYLYRISQADGLIYAEYYNSDSAPTASSTKLVQSGGVKTYVDDSIQSAKDDWFLRGPLIPANSDFNDYQTPGHFYVNSITNAQTMTNIPVEYSGRLEVIATNSNTEYLRQTYYANTDSTGLICIRRMNTSPSGWSDWVIFPTPANVISSTFGTLNATIIPLAGVDVDTLTTPGVWIVSSTDAAKNCSGRPDYANAASKIFRLEVKNMSSTRVFQEMFVYRIGTYEGDFDRYQRMRKTDGTWNDWQHIDTTVVSTYYPSP